MADDALARILDEAYSCKHCVANLPHEPRPILSARRDSKIVIIGQAPGARVHLSGIPWKDQSGVALRDWLGVDEAMFYDARNFALLPMGFCYPGKSRQGDLPPRPECAPMWHKRILNSMTEMRLALLVGKYAQDFYLNRNWVHECVPSVGTPKLASSRLLRFIEPRRAKQLCLHASDK